MDTWCTKTLLCQLCVGRVGLLKPRRILGKYGKVSKNGTFSIFGLKIWGGSRGFRVRSLEVWVFFWENLTPVCDFYLKSEQVFLL